MKFTDEQLRDAVRRCVADLGGVSLSVSQYRQWSRANPGAPSEGPIFDRVGWFEACRQAGVTTGQIPRRWTAAEMIAAVKRCAAESGTATLASATYQRWAERNEAPSLSAIDVHLGWLEACRRARVEPGRRRWSDTELIDAVARCAKALGTKRLTGLQYRRWHEKSAVRLPAWSLIDQRIGWGNACQAAGLIRGRQNQR